MPPCCACHTCMSATAEKPTIAWRKKVSIILCLTTPWFPWIRLVLLSLLQDLGLEIGFYGHLHNSNHVDEKISNISEKLQVFWTHVEKSMKTQTFQNDQIRCYFWIINGRTWTSLYGNTDVKFWNDRHQSFISFMWSLGMSASKLTLTSRRASEV